MPKSDIEQGKNRIGEPLGCPIPLLTQTLFEAKLLFVPKLK